MVSVISEWVRCPICGNKTRLQMPAGEAQGNRDKPDRGGAPGFCVLLRIQYPGPDDTDNFYAKYFLNVLRTDPTPAFSSVK